MVGSSDRIDGWWSKKLLPPAIQKRARVLVIMKQYPILRERNGASPASEASTPSFALDTAVVVIDRMTTFRFSCTLMQSCGAPPGLNVLKSTRPHRLRGGLSTTPTGQKQAAWGGRAYGARGLVIRDHVKAVCG